jgi:hypothetical protein
LAYAYTQTPGNGSNRLFTVAFPFIVRAHVKVYLNYDVAAGTGTQLVDGTGFTWLSDTQIQTTVAPALGVTLTVIRKTPNGSQLVVWAPGSPPTPADLNTADLQSLYVIQEQADLTEAAVITATAAAATANAAAAAVAAALLYQPVANVASIPASPVVGQRIEISNTTGLGAYSPVSGRPAGFVGSSGVKARLIYGTPTAAAWNWIDYFPVDPDGRYATITAANTAQTTANTAQTTANTAQTTADNAQTTADNAGAAAATAQARAERAPALQTAKDWNWNGQTNNASIDFTDIPNWVRRVTMIFSGVSASTDANILVQLGTGSTPTAAGYTDGFSVIATPFDGNSYAVTSAAGVPVYNQAAFKTTGQITFTNIAGNTWVASGGFSVSAGIGGQVTSGGSIALSGTLGMIRATVANGSFDSGTFNIIYE